VSVRLGPLLLILLCANYSMKLMRMTNRQLSDVNRDGALSLDEFCTAMHLVVLRRNDIELPDTLPPVLQPYTPLVTSGTSPESVCMHTILTANASFQGNLTRQFLVSFPFDLPSPFVPN